VKPGGLASFFKGIYDFFAKLLSSRNAENTSEPSRPPAGGQGSLKGASNSTIQNQNSNIKEGARPGPVVKEPNTGSTNEQNVGNSPTTKERSTPQSSESEQKRTEDLKNSTPKANGIQNKDAKPNNNAIKLPPLPSEFSKNLTPPGGSTMPSQNLAPLPNQQTTIQNQNSIKSEKRPAPQLSERKQKQIENLQKEIEELKAEMKEVQTMGLSPSMGLSLSLVEKKVEWLNTEIGNAKREIKKLLEDKPGSSDPYFDRAREKRNELFAAHTNKERLQDFNKVHSETMTDEQFEKKHGFAIRTLGGDKNYIQKFGITMEECLCQGKETQQ
jgi:hypothetical protein